MAKKRKFTTLTVTLDGNTYKKSVAYRNVAELSEKREEFIAELKRKNSKAFSLIADEWNDKHSEEVEYYTASCYAAPLKDLKAEFGDDNIDEITSISFQKFLDDMAKKGFAKQTIKLRQIVMSQIFDYAIFKEYITYNPIKVCKVSKQAKQTARQLPPDSDIIKIKENCDSVYGLYCMLLMYTGLRREEALALEYEDLDFENHLIRVNKALIFENGRGVIRNKTKTNAGQRFIPLLPILETLFDRNQKGLIFTSNGKPLEKYQFDKGFNKFKKATGITCTSHQLRHYFATVCFDAGLDEKDTQEIMGHSKISLTKDIYTHIRKERKNDAYNKLKDFMNA